MLRAIEPLFLLLPQQHAQGHHGEDNHQPSACKQQARTTLLLLLLVKLKKKLFKLRNNKVLVKLPVRGGPRGNHANQAEMLLLPRCMHGERQRRSAAVEGKTKQQPQLPCWLGETLDVGRKLHRARGCNPHTGTHIHTVIFKDMAGAFFVCLCVSVLP